MTQDTSIVVGRTVRLVRLIAQAEGGAIRRALYGQILTVAPILPENMGTNGEPTISVVLLDPQAINVLQLGKVDWHQALDRQTGVRHASHPDVIEGRTSIFYTDVLPLGGDAINLEALNLTDLSEPVVPVETSGNTAAPAPQVANMAPAIPTVQQTQEEAYGTRGHVIDAVHEAEEAAYRKSSGDGHDAGDWTQAEGDGLDYPGAKKAVQGIPQGTTSTPSTVQGVIEPEPVVPVEKATSADSTALGMNGATEAPVVGKEHAEAAEVKKVSLGVFPHDGKFFVGYSENETLHGPWNTWAEADEWRAGEQKKIDAGSAVD